MVEGATVAWLILTGMGAAFGGVAAVILALAWYRWAGRCDPKNPNFRPPLTSHKP